MRTDSQSALRSLAKPGIKDRLECEIIRRICCLAKRSREIRFSWVRGHSGIVGNEEADHEAGEALPNEEVWITPLKIVRNELDALAARDHEQHLKQSGKDIHGNAVRKNPTIKNGSDNLGTRRNRVQKVALNHLRLSGDSIF